jgi:hypothetical protein
VLAPLLLGGLLAGGATPAAAQQTRITGVDARGSGCPSGSVDVLTNGDQSSLLFSQFAATTSRDMPIASVRCDVQLQLEMEAGVGVSEVEILWQGTMALEPGSRGMFMRSLAFPGARPIQQTQGYSDPFNAISLDDRLMGIPVVGCSARRRMGVRAGGVLTLMGVGSAEVQSADATTFKMLRLNFGLSPCRERPQDPPDMRMPPDTRMPPDMRVPPDRRPPPPDRPPRRGPGRPGQD